MFFSDILYMMTAEANAKVSLFYCNVMYKK